ncbi:DNA-processing protein DprA, partial [Candidatus Latescibacterota bacterium]
FETPDSFEYEDLSSRDSNFREIYKWLISLRKAGYDPSRVETLFNGELTDIEKEYLDLDIDFIIKKQVQIVRDGDKYYPTKFSHLLEDKRPKMLFCMGDITLLNKPSIFVCGARDASKIGLELAYKCGRLIAEEGFVVVSGYARGVDMEAHLGALEAGGSTIAILPYGLSRFSVRRALMDVFEPGRFLAFSELPPTCSFKVHTAFRRNKLLAALADAVIVVEPGESGGTWYSAKKACSLHKPLFFFEGSRPEIIHEIELMGGKRLSMRNGAPKLQVVYKKCKQ